MSYSLSDLGLFLFQDSFVTSLLVLFWNDDPDIESKMIHIFCLWLYSGISENVLYNLLPLT